MRLSALNNRVPGPVLALEVIGAAAALALLALHISLSAAGSRLLVAAALVSALLLITFDLDRPTRGLITVPNTVLVDLRASMALPPAATVTRPDARRRAVAQVACAQPWRSTSSQRNSSSVRAARSAPASRLSQS